MDGDAGAAGLLRGTAPDEAPSQISGEAEVRGARLLELLERPFTWLEAPFARAVPESLDPIAQSGAVANTCLIVALVTGVLVLPFYTPSVGGAHASVERMVGSPWTAGLLRSLHRYSSDAAMAFILLHPARLTVARRIAGARWLAWITGLALLALTWLVGWTGYWLVWDERARQVALTTSWLLDALPIFVDPLSRSFVADDSVNTLLFFVVFFLHMLVPLAMGIALWLHVSRLSRSRFLTSRVMSALVVAALVVMSLALPATSAAPARMAMTPARLSLDAWYLGPVVVAEHLSAGAGWALLVVVSLALVAVPWTMVRRRARVAVVDRDKCHACTTCTKDCPFAAITMVARGDDSGVELIAQVDAARCVGCGICAGSCDPSAIGLTWFDEIAERRRIEAWVAQADTQVMVLGCERSAAGRLAVDPATGRCAELPGARVLIVPCTGWIHPLTLERALRRGAQGALVIGCPPGACRYREGDRWLDDRVFAGREPALRTGKVDAARIRHVQIEPGLKARISREVNALARGAGAPRTHRVPWLIVSVALVSIACAGIVAGSRVPHVPAGAGDSSLVLTLRQSGQVVEHCRDLSPEELAALPAHMRQPRQCDRGRAPVRVRLDVDGQRVLDHAFPAAGLWSDGQSFAVRTLPVAPGTHAVRVAVADSALDPAQADDAVSWTMIDARDLAFQPGERHVVRVENGELSWR